jgi:hypothetical protein
MAIASISHTISLAVIELGFDLDQWTRSDYQ